MPFFVGVLLATAATSVPDALGDVLAAAHRDNIAQAADKFAPPTVDERSDGAPFRVVLPIADGTINGRDPPNSSFFAYKPDEGVLELHLSPIGERTTGRGSDGLMDVLTFEVFRLGRRVAAGPSYAGQNVFGVSARVSVVRERYDAIAVLDAPGVTNLKDIHYPTYDVALSLAGPDARKVAADAVVEIEGKLARLDNGHLARCTSDYSGPTVRHPTEKSMVTCSAGAIIRRIAFVRKSTGEVLKEWLTDDTAAAGPVLWQRVRYGMTLKQFALAYPDLDWPKYRSSIRIVDGSSVATVTHTNTACRKNATATAINA